MNLNTGSPIGLTAYADADSIAEYLSSDDVVVVEPADTAAAVKDSIKSSGKDLWQTVFAECDFTSVKDGTFPQAFSYEKDGDIYLIVPVSHAAGDYALVKYSPETKYNRRIRKTIRLISILHFGMIEGRKKHDLPIGL